MKYLGILFLVLMTTWTWSIVNCEVKMPFETHAAIQEKLADVLVAAILSKKPTASDISTEKLWTELLHENQLLAHFTYSFKETSSEGEAITTRISGVGTLEKDPVDTNNWKLVSIKTDSDTIIFDQGLIVSPDKDDSNQ